MTAPFMNVRRAKLLFEEYFFNIRRFVGSRIRTTVFVPRRNTLGNLLLNIRVSCRFSLMISNPANLLTHSACLFTSYDPNILSSVWSIDRWRLSTSYISINKHVCIINNINNIQIARSCYEINEAVRFLILLYPLNHVQWNCVL